MAANNLFGIIAAIKTYNWTIFEYLRKTVVDMQCIPVLVDDIWYIGKPWWHTCAFRSFYLISLHGLNICQVIWHRIIVGKIAFFGFTKVMGQIIYPSENMATRNAFL